MSPPPVYATNVDYIARFGALPSGFSTSDVDLRLARASRVVDQVLTGALYATDSITQIATDSDVQASIKAATLEQAAFWYGGMGSEFGVPAYDEVKIGSVHLKGAMRNNAELAPTALYELSQANLVPISARTFG